MQAKLLLSILLQNRIFADQGEILIDSIQLKENIGVHLKKIFCMSEADLYDRDLKVKEHFKMDKSFLCDLI